LLSQLRTELLATIREIWPTVIARRPFRKR